MTIAPASQDIRGLDAVPAVRHVSVTPSMCGQHSLLAAQVGDWTWENVSANCGMDVLTARTDDGAPAYLAFAYIRIKGSRRVHPLGLTFGDRLAVATQSFASGPGTVLTLHLLHPGGGPAAEAVDLDEYFHNPDPDTLYVENVNRWVRRSVAGTNQGLASVVPSGFRQHGMQRLPQEFTPRSRIQAAQQAGTLLPPHIVQRTPVGTHRVAYTVDPSRDLNGVGLVFFASYFSFADAAVLAYWEHLGRSLHSYLDRKVIDNRMCYFSNTDPGAELEITVTGYPALEGGEDEFLDIRMYDRQSNSLLALNSQHLAH